MDFVLKDSVGDYFTADILEFQSLFYWILFLRSAFVTLSDSIAKFQSLFYWILFLRAEQAFKILNDKKVSILVLLDFVLKVKKVKNNG